MSKVCILGGNNPYENLAIEEFFTGGEENSPLFLLWQNNNTIVIGKNQNPFSECNLSELEKQKTTLVRRSSGGGAVFHDMGNLCFSFIMPKHIYDIDRQFSVIINALQEFDIAAAPSGRNDIEISGCKFSGSAFFSKSMYCHHGTLLIDTDFSKLSLLLTPSKQKIESKGIKSVVSRVVNLSQICPLITVKNLSNALISTFQKEYGEAILITPPNPFEYEIFLKKYKS